MLRKQSSPYDHLIASLMAMAVGWGEVVSEGNGYLNDDDSHNKNDICLVPAAVKNINTLLFVNSMNPHNNVMLLLVMLSLNLLN